MNMHFSNTSSRTDLRGIGPFIRRIGALGLAAGFGLAIISSTASADSGSQSYQSASLQQGALGATPNFAPSVLSAGDAQRYARIFVLQESGRWSEADSLIKKLDDRILMGHVLFQRYMHPTAYRSKYEELRDWMGDYSDHPGASRIYRLALKRRPRNWRRPKRPERRKWRVVEPEMTAFRAHNPARSYRERRRVRAIEHRVRNLLSRERPTQALNYVSERRTRTKLTQVEFDNIRSWIAASYFIEEVDHKSYALAKEVSRVNRDAVPMADWTAGLAAWRMDKRELAAGHFEAAAEAKYMRDDDRSAAAFWAARAYHVTGSADKVVPLLRRAADYPMTFYGILARRQLGLSITADWQPPALTQEGLSRVLQDNGVKRAAALAQVGRLADAEAEMVRAHGRLDAKDDEALLSLASAMGLAHSQMMVSLLSGGKPGFEAGLYPIPKYSPAGGFSVDRALLFAIIRKESKFETAVESRAGARGLMQVLPSSAAYLSGDRRYRRAHKNHLFDPSINMKLGQDYTKYLMKNTNPAGNLVATIASYNAGPGNVRRWFDKMDFKNDPLVFLESIPFRETRNYVERVMANLWIYRARMKQRAPSLDMMAAGAWPIYTPVETEPGADRLAALEE